MESIRNIIDRSIQAICSILFIAMVSVASWQVISRYILNSPSTISEAFLRCSLVWLSMMAIAYMAGHRGHVSLTLLTDRLSGKPKVIFDMTIELIFILFACLVMIYGGMQATFNTMSQMYPMLQIPKGVIYLSLPVSGTIITMYCLLNCLSLYRSSLNQEVKP